MSMCDVKKSNIRETFQIVTQEKYLKEERE